MNKFRQLMLVSFLVFPLIQWMSATAYGQHGAGCSCAFCTGQRLSAAPTSPATAPLIANSVASSTTGQNIWVDFSSDFHNGNDGASNGVADWIDELNEATDRAGTNRFSAAERATIENNILTSLNNIYGDYNLNFVTTQPDGIHEVIYFGQDNDNPGVGNGTFGSAQSDIGNLDTNTYTASFLADPDGDPNSVAKVATGNFNSALEPAFDTREQSIQEISTSLAGTAAHELGHTLGLQHHFSYSAVGITPDNLNNTGGLQNQHVIATGGTGLNEREREGADRTLSSFSRVILDIAGGVTSELGDFGRENIAIVDNPVFSDASELGSQNDAGDTFATAQQLSFQRGDTSGADISFVEADLDGGADDVDVFSFTTTEETTFFTHLFSEELRFAREFDPEVALFDISGTEIASSDDISYGGDTIDVDTIAGLASSNTSTSDDSFLFNIVLDPGTYFLEVRATDVDISDTPLAGDQYFLVTSLVPSTVAIPEPSSAILLALALSSGLLTRRRSLAG